MRWQLASTFAVAAMSAACYGPATRDCGDGYLCAAGFECAAPGFCGKAAQVAACIDEEIADYNRCENPASGTCRHGVCEECSPDRAGCPTNGFVAVSKPADDDLFGVWVGRRDLAFAVGAGGATWRYDGWVWTVMTPAPLLIPENKLAAIWGTDEQNLYAVGETRVFKWNGASWDAVIDAGINLNAIGGTSATDITAAGDAGKVVELVGDSWISSQAESTISISLLGVTTAGTTTYVTGQNGTVLKKEAGEWSIARDPDGATPNMNAIWALGASDIVAVGEDATLIEGPNWSSKNFGSILSPAASYPFRGVWGDAEHVFAVGALGTIMERRATSTSSPTWSPIPQNTLPSRDELKAIAGADGVVFAVGVAGAIWRYSP